MDKTCGNCQYWKKGLERRVKTRENPDSKEIGTPGQCRKLTPLLAAADEKWENVKHELNCFPPTTSDCWCGEYKPLS